MTVSDELQTKQKPTFM